MLLLIFLTEHVFYFSFAGSYRALYLLNWVYRFYFEGFFDLIAVVAGCVQTVLYCDFFYLYITKGKIPKWESREFLVKKIELIFFEVLIT